MGSNKVFIDFPREIVEGYLFPKDEVFRRLKGEKYDYEGVHSIRDREKHINIPVVVYSCMDCFCGTQFICYKKEAV